ncbi:AMP-binding protein [Govanella unica]|uniref:AMP-binding protein n=1 Tax=Govanella unica TaxID=2975056 RepID=A0A9X3TXY8_9PROT|nr:AMP-binding protein [Govania unica]MDA5193841.1 AMP-binding protein [Govania unica]
MTEQAITLPPYRKVSFPSAAMNAEWREDGTIIVSPVTSLEAFVPSISSGLQRRAAHEPERMFLAQRKGLDRQWQFKTNADIKRETDAVAQWLLNLSIEGQRPMLILSANSIEHAVMRFGAMSAGVPICPVSVNYARIKGSYERLRHVVELIRPAVVFADDTAFYKDALESIDFADALIVTQHPESLSVPAVSYEAVLSTPVQAGLDDHIKALDPDAPAAYMLTSGSTGKPKAVIQTQRMMATNIQQALQVMREANGWADLVLDWMPWSHVAGTSNLLGTLMGGGSFYIDDGKPLPGLFEESIRNLKEIPVRYFSNVPAGYAMLADALERDDDLRRIFFSQLRLFLYGGAGLSQPLYDRLQRMAIESTGERIFFTTGYGATETTSGSMSIYYHSEEVGIGLPLPGTTVKLVPYGDRYEVRMKGDVVTPGYLNMPEKNAEIFDDEGFYKLGDAARFIDPDNLQRGFAFAGRLAEEFKLDTGTWVSGGVVRAEALKALDPLAREALVCGERRAYIALLIWPSEATIGDIPAFVRERLRSYNATHGQKSMRIERVMFLSEPPSVDAHEVSEKGSINQLLALQRRAADVERLYADHPDDSVIVI